MINTVECYQYLFLFNFVDICSSRSVGCTVVKMLKCHPPLHELDRMHGNHVQDSGNLRNVYMGCIPVGSLQCCYKSECMCNCTCECGVNGVQCMYVVFVYST